MTIAAFVISVLALLVSGASAYFTARNSRRDEARWRNERTPTFKGTVEAVGDGGWHRLRLRLTSRETVSSVRVEIVEGEGIEFTPAQSGVESGAQGPIRSAAAHIDKRSPGEMRPDDEASWRVHLSDEQAAAMRLRVHAAIGSTPYEVGVPVELPPPPPMVW